MNELPAKYQRLATEYAKLKAQNQVLKKAVFDKQSNISSLNEKLQMKEQETRRFQQEIDSSNFRNEQMSKRISILQEEVEKKQNKSKQRGKEEPHLHNRAAIDDDLRVKISENERLHKQLYDSELKSRDLERAYNDNLKQSSHDYNSLKSENEALNEELRNFKLKFHEDKAFLEKKLMEVETKSNEIRIVNERKISELSGINEELLASKSQLRKILEDTVVFNDSSNPAFVKLKVVNNDKRFQSKYKNIITSIETYVKDLCKGLINFHSSFQERAFCYPINSEVQDLPGETIKLCSFQSEAKELLQDISSHFTISFIDVDFNVVLRNSLEVQEFVKKCHLYAALVDKLQPYLLNFLSQECDASLCVPNLQSKNNSNLTVYQRLIPLFSKLFVYLEILLKNSSSDSEVVMENCGAILHKIISVFNEFHLIFKDLSKLLNGKVLLEYELPTTTKSPKLRTANDLLFTTMIQLSSTCAKLSVFLQENEEFLSSEVSKLADVDPILSILHKNTSSFLQQVNIFTPPDSVAYEEALQLKNSTHHFDDNESKEEVKKLNRKIEDLEQEKGYWLLETQLLQMKLEKQVTNEEQKETKLKIEHRVRTNSSSPTDVSTLGSLHIEDHGDAGGMQTTEELIKHHMNARLTDACRKNQLIESRAQHFENECERLQKHLTVSKNQIQNIEGKLGNSSQEMSLLRDELALTSKNYEQQLGLMTEHLAAMNEKLASQQEEIETLKMKKKNRVFGNSS